MVLSIFMIGEEVRMSAFARPGASQSEFLARHE
jgi:hypothetical protein